MTTPTNMPASMPIDRVANLLGSAGYRRVETPLTIAGLKFELAAAFVGQSPSPDLVIVVDSVNDTDQRMLRKVEGVARALDIVRSRRPLTAVVTGPRPTPATLEAMARVCRVLPIGTLIDANAEVALRNWLAVLLPLDLPEPTASIADPLSTASLELQDMSSQTRELTTVALQGARAVRNRLHTLVESALSDVSDEML